MGYSNKTFACPFFRWDERLRVHCEGGCVSFRDRQEATEYIDRHCADLKDWNSCSLACSLLRYYERTDRHGA